RNTGVFTHEYGFADAGLSGWQPSTVTGIQHVLGTTVGVDTSVVSSNQSGYELFASILTKTVNNVTKKCVGIAATDWAHLNGTWNYAMDCANDFSAIKQVYDGPVMAVDQGTGAVWFVASEVATGNSKDAHLYYAPGAGCGPTGRAPRWHQT